MITANVTINGPGSSDLTISGNNQSRVFFVAASLHVSVADLTVADGFDLVRGGGIFNDGTLNLTDCTVEDSSTTEGYYTGGGGIYNDSTLIVSDCTIQGNISDGHDEAARAFTTTAR